MKIVKICTKGMAVVLSVIMLTGLILVTVQADASNGADYSFNSETGELTIHSDSGTTSWRDDESISKEAVKSVEFQRRYDASPILNIGAHAFDGCTNLSGTIKLNAQTTSIGEDAFKDCNSLETILIPKAVQGQIESAGIPDSTAYVLFEFDGNTLDFFVTDIKYGTQKQIVFEGTISNGTWGCSGCALIAEENLKIVPSETGNGGRAWYYKYAEDGGIIVTKYTPKVRNGIAEGRTVELPKTLAGYDVNGFSDTAFSDSRLNANQVFVIDDSTNVVLPDSVSKLLITETNGRKEAYFTSGNAGTVDTNNIPSYSDVKTLYAKGMIIDSSSSHMLVMTCSTVSYKENANGDIVITNATFGMFSEEQNFTVPTYIKGSPVTTVMINTYNNKIDKILVDESVNEITYEYRSYSSGSNAPVITSVTQGSGQKCIEIPTEIAGVAIAEVPETAFNASVTCIVVSEDTQANVPSYVSKIIYKTDASGNKIITGIVAGTDASGKKIAVSIPATIGGSKPVISEEAKRDMQDIPHTHHYLSGVCTDCGATDGSSDMQDKLISVTAPAPIIVANGTAYAVMNLPKQLNIVTERGTVDKADVKWDTTKPESGSYNPSVLTEQSVILKGTITCPATIDANGVSLTTTITIKISAAGITGAPICTPVAGTYTDNQSVTIASSTEGAAIYYTTDGTKPSASNGAKYTTPISVTGTEGQSVVTTIKAVAVMDGMQDSEVQTFTYTIRIPVTTYKIIDGADSTWTQNTDGSIVIRGNGEFSKFTGVKVDGTLVDAKNYTVKEGSTIVTLKADYLNTLSEGTHTFEILWTDGSASTTFTIKADTSNDGNNKADVPKTGDDTPVVWLLVISILSGAGFIITAKKRRINAESSRR